MSEQISSPRRVAVIGGGIAGLAAAYRIGELDPTAHVTLFEAGDRLGGSLWAVERDGFLIEQGADSFITNVPWGVDLCRRVGLADELISTNEAGRRAFVVRRGRLVPVPDGFLLMAPSRVWPIATTPLLSPLGKLRLACEYFVPRRADNGDESLASFVRRRLGREVFERLVQPLVAGIYTADPEKLSLAATLPRFQEMERQYGGLIRATLWQRRATKDAKERESSESGARYGLFVTPRRGLSSLVNAVAGRLPVRTIQLNSPIDQIARIENRWNITVAVRPQSLPLPLGEGRGEGGLPNSSPSNFDAVVLAVPPPVASRLLTGVDGELAGELSAIEYAGATVVSSTYRRDQIAHPLDGFGFVVPTIERRRILSASFSSVKFPGRAPDGKVLIRTFVGGACQSELAELSEDQLRQLVREELAELLGIRGEPQWSLIAQWTKSMPQYHLGHLERVARIEARIAALTGLALAGSGYRGVGIPHAIHSGEQAAERICG